MFLQFRIGVVAFEMARGRAMSPSRCRARAAHGACLSDAHGRVGLSEVRKQSSLQGRQLHRRVLPERHGSFQVMVVGSMGWCWFSKYSLAFHQAPSRSQIPSTADSSTRTRAYAKSQHYAVHHEAFKGIYNNYTEGSTGFYIVPLILLSIYNGTVYKRGSFGISSR